jgi:hypothetical protein
MVVDFSGGHVGYVTHFVGFAARLAKVLADRDSKNRIASLGQGNYPASPPSP